MSVPVRVWTLDNDWRWDRPPVVVGASSLGRDERVRVVEAAPVAEAIERLVGLLPSPADCIGYREAEDCTQAQTDAEALLTTLRSQETPDGD